MSDEWWGNGLQELIGIVLWYVDEDLNIREDSVAFQTTERITGSTLAAIIHYKVGDWDLDIEDCRGQCYDGASTTSSSNKGVQGIISKHKSLALYVHCSSHV